MQKSATAADADESTFSFWEGKILSYMQSSQISFMQPFLYCLVVPCLILSIKKSIYRSEVLLYNTGAVLMKSG